jgi:hypothetical protein
MFAEGRHGLDLGFESDLAKILLGVGEDGSDEVGVGAVEERFDQFDDDDLGAEGGVDRAEFHADVAAANDQERFGDVRDLEGLVGGHHARVAEVEGFGQGGF